MLVKTALINALAAMVLVAGPSCRPQAAWAREPSAQASDPLPSWRNGPVKNRILRFVKDVTDKSGEKFVPEESRIAVFNSDGTLVVERPSPMEMAFALEQVPVLVKAKPQLAEVQPFKGVLARDPALVGSTDVNDSARLLSETHAGWAEEDFKEQVAGFLDAAEHPRFHKPYPALTYFPMNELMAYLRQNGFKTYIVAGGTTEFLRTFAEKAYEAPPEQVIGNSVLAEMSMRDGKLVMVRRPVLVEPLNDHGGKAFNVERAIGRKPILVGGSSDGDREMMLWADSSARKPLNLLVVHDDAKREYAYTKGAEKIFAEAQKRGWVIASMKRDFKALFREQETIERRPAGKKPRKS